MTTKADKKTARAVTDSEAPRGEVLLYRAKDGNTALEVRLAGDTVWLSQHQLAELFGRERSVITKHIRNVFAEGELDAKAVCAKYAHTAPGGKTYQVDHFNAAVHGCANVAGGRMPGASTSSVIGGCSANVAIENGRFRRISSTMTGCHHAVT